MAGGSGYAVDLKAVDMRSAVFNSFPTCIQSMGCNQSQGSQRSPVSPSFSSPLRKNKVSLDGQRVYRARQALTDLNVTGRKRTFGREICGISLSTGKQRGGSSKPKVLADLVVMVRERFMLLLT